MRETEQQKNLEKRERKNISSSYWFIPHMLATVGAGPELGTQSRSAMWLKGP